MARLPSQLTYNDLNGAEAVESIMDWVRQLLLSDPLMQPHLTLPMADIRIGLKIDIDMYVGGSVPVNAPPEQRSICGAVTLTNGLTNGLERLDHEIAQHRSVDLTARVNAAPIPGGQPPDAIRESHGLPVPRPGYGPRDTGSHLFLADIVEEHDRKLSLTGGREGIVADGYTFASDPASASPTEQTIDLANGAIEIDMAGRGIAHAGMVVKDDSHRKSVKQFGDQRGDRYSSVNGVYDPGPAGLMNNRGGGGLGTDGRQRLQFGNNNRG